MIRLEDITHSYETEAVLSDFSIKIEEGAFVTIIGSSGCGKTTVLKLMNGLLKPEKGTVFIRGEDISGVDLVRLRRGIGYVIQDVGLFPHMTVEKNIRYVMDLEKKKDEQDINKRVKHIIEIVGLREEMLARYPDELSGGQRQRVGIARALLPAPDIMLMDEPFGAVDSITRKKLQNELVQIHQKIGCTIVFITHDIQEALKLGTKVAVMDQGVLLQYDVPEQIKTNPAAPFVAELMQV